MTLFAAVACQLCWNLFSACSVFILSSCSPPRCCTWKGATQHLLSWKFQQGRGAAASGAISLLEMFFSLRVGLPAQKCLYLTTCEIKLFACCGKSKGEQCCIMEERGKTLTVTQCHCNSSLCVNDKWQWDISTAIFNLHLYFLLIPVGPMGGDYVTHSCVTKVSLFLFYFLHFLISNTSKNLILLVVINWQMTSDLGNLDVWLLSHKY